MSEQEGIRIGTYLASCGVCSRRGAGQLLDEGRVKVNGKVTRDLSFRVVPGVHEVHVNNKPVHAREVVTLLYNKPKGVVMSHLPPKGNLRSWTEELPRYKHLKPAGRLDAMSEGLVVLSNDGDLINRLTHPRHKVAKVYKVWLRGRVDKRSLRYLQTGAIELDGRRVLPCKVEQIPGGKGKEFLTQWTLVEGRNRQIRRMAEAAGLIVTKLVRERVGPLTLKGLPPGCVKPLGKKELDQLEQALAEAAQKKKRPVSEKRTRNAR